MAEEMTPPAPVEGVVQGLQRLYVLHAGQSAAVVQDLEEAQAWVLWARNRMARLEEALEGREASLRQAAQAYADQQQRLIRLDSVAQVARALLFAVDRQPAPSPDLIERAAVLRHVISWLDQQTRTPDQWRVTWRQFRELLAAAHALVEGQQNFIPQAQRSERAARLAYALELIEGGMGDALQPLLAADTDAPPEAGEEKGG